MTEYIKREDAIDAVLDVYYNTPDIDLNGERLKAAILKVQPTYITPSGRLRGVTYEDGNVTSVHIMDTDDVVKVFAPVRHGRWMNANSRPKTYWRRCTACGGLAHFCGIGCSYKYCPNCGADMRGSNDE